MATDIRSGSQVSVISYHLFLHVLVELLPTSLVLEAGLCQVNWEHTGDANHACNPSVDQLGWQAVQRQSYKTQLYKCICGAGWGSC